MSSGCAVAGTIGPVRVSGVSARQRERARAKALTRGPSVRFAVTVVGRRLAVPVRRRPAVPSPAAVSSRVSLKPAYRLQPQGVCLSYFLAHCGNWSEIILF